MIKESIMERRLVKLLSIDDVKSFVNTVSMMDGDFDLCSGKYVVNAKSMMGIFSLDFQKPMELIIHSPTDDVMEVLEKFFQ